MHWNHRTVVHRNTNPNALHEEDYLTVHEIYYSVGENTGDDSTDAEGPPEMLWCPSEASPRTKQEAQWIMNAFDKPPIAWVDDASITYGECGSVDYKKWGWL